MLKKMLLRKSLSLVLVLAVVLPGAVLPAAAETPATITTDNGDYLTNSTLSPSVAAASVTAFEWQWAWTADAPNGAWHTIGEASPSPKSIYLTQDLAGKYVRFMYTNASGSYYSEATPAIRYEHNLVHKSAITSLTSPSYSGAITDNGDGTYSFDTSNLNLSSEKSAGYFGIGSTFFDVSDKEDIDESSAKADKAVWASITVKRTSDAEGPLKYGMRIGKGNHDYDNWLGYNEEITKEFKTITNKYRTLHSDYGNRQGALGWFDFVGDGKNGWSSFADAGTIIVKDLFFALNAPYAENVNINGIMQCGQNVTADYTLNNDYSVFVYNNVEFPRTIDKSRYQWYMADNAYGDESGGWTAIDGATSSTLNLTGEMEGKYVRVEVTPRSIPSGASMNSYPATGVTVSSPAMKVRAPEIFCDTDDYLTNSTLSPSVAADSVTAFEWQWAWAADAPNGAWHTIGEASPSPKSIYLTQDLAGKYVRFMYTNASGSYYSEATPAIRYEHNLVHKSAITSLTSPSYSGAITDNGDGTYSFDTSNLNLSSEKSAGYFGIGSTFFDVSDKEDIDESSAKADKAVWASITVKRTSDAEGPLKYGMRIGKGNHDYDNWLGYNEEITKEFKTITNKYRTLHSDYGNRQGALGWFDFVGDGKNGWSSFADAGTIIVKDLFFALNAPYAENVNINGIMQCGQNVTADYTLNNDYSVFVYNNVEFPRTIDKSRYQWYMADNAYGDESGGWTAIDGATSSTLNLTGEMEGKYVRVEVTPRSIPSDKGGDPMNSYPATGVTVSSPAMKVRKAQDTGVTFTGTVAAGNTLSGTAYFNNENSTEGNYMAFIAVYNDGALCACEGVRFNILSADADAERNFSVTIPAEAAGNLTVKTFLWSDDLVPVK